MGTKLKEIIIKKEISLDELKNKKLVIDSFNVLYQFLSSIRQRDGSLLTDSHGNVTSHLVGLFSRTTKLMQYGIKPAFVFDGKAPEMKWREAERRAGVKAGARLKYEEAAKKEDVEEMKKYASRTSKLTNEMVEDAKKVIESLGLPVIQAPSEGEAQAAYIVNKGDAWAEVSQDYDCLLFGVKRLLQNLTISEKKKLPGKLSYENISPQLIELEPNLKEMGINQEQMVVMGVLIGTDYNLGGIKGIGPKNALKLVKEYKGRYDDMFKKLEWGKYFDFPWKEVYDLIKNMPVTDDYELKWKDINKEKIVKHLVDKHDFSIERVESTLEKLNKFGEQKKQTGLGSWVK